VRYSAWPNPTHCRKAATFRKLTDQVGNSGRYEDLDGTPLAWQRDGTGADNYVLPVCR
jgi:hypothetical protein